MWNLRARIVCLVLLSQWPTAQKRAMGWWWAWVWKGTLTNSLQPHTTLGISPFSSETTQLCAISRHFFHSYTPYTQPPYEIGAQLDGQGGAVQDKRRKTEGSRQGGQGDEGDRGEHDREYKALMERTQGKKKAVEFHRQEQLRCVTLYVYQF